MTLLIATDSFFDLYRRIAQEFGLGRPLDVGPLAHDHPEVVKLTTERGHFVVMTASDVAQVELYERVAATLNQEGIWQGESFPTEIRGLAASIAAAVAWGKSQTAAVMAWWRARMGRQDPGRAGRRLRRRLGREILRTGQRALDSRDLA